jgi:hypothetical protein
MAWADDVRRGNAALDRGAASLEGPVPMGIAKKLRENRAEYSDMYKKANPGQMTPVGPSQIRKLADAAHIADSNRDAGHLVNMDWMRNMYGKGIANVLEQKVGAKDQFTGQTALVGGATLDNKNRKPIYSSGRGTYGGTSDWGSLYNFDEGTDSGITELTTES